MLCQVPYRLHAVLVHEGQANAGHYWAYIYDPRQHCWMKYNDITVTKSSWEELVRDSFGGYRNASAYCLMYIDDKKPFLIEGNFWRCFSTACFDSHSRYGRASLSFSWVAHQQGQGLHNDAVSNSCNAVSTPTQLLQL